MEKEDECPICLETFDDNNSSIPYNCNHKYHSKCITYLLNTKLKSSTKCLLCMNSLKKPLSDIDLEKINYVFNNQCDDNDIIFDLSKYLKKWKYPSCFSSKHKITIETLGDWGLNSNNDLTLKFTFKKMYIKCENCNNSIIV